MKHYNETQVSALEQLKRARNKVARAKAKLIAERQKEAALIRQLARMCAY